MKVFANVTVGMVIVAEDKKKANVLLKAQMVKDGLVEETIKDVVKATKEIKLDKEKVVDVTTS
jgi:hypothetical protein